MLREKFVCLCAVVCLLAGATGVQAVPFGFYNITNNNAADAAAGEAQLTVDVHNGAGMVKFDFFNTGSIQMVIAEIYFDNGPLLGISNIDASVKSSSPQKTS